VNWRPDWAKEHLPEIKSLIRGAIFTALCALAAYWGAIVTVKNAIQEPWFVNAAIDQISKNFVGSSYHANFYMGRDTDNPQYTIPFYVSKNQEVELYIKATHYTPDEDKDRREIDVFVGGKKIDRIKISSSSDYKKGFSLTDPVIEAMTEASWDYTKNIQRVEFRLAPSKYKNTNFVLIEALLVTVGIPKKHDDGGDQ
jgi:hypothetical protein